MKYVLLLFVLTLNPAWASTECTCKCVIKESDGSYGLAKGKGKNRQEAGEDLKKKMGKKTCELTPECAKNCW